MVVRAPALRSSPAQSVYHDADHAPDLVGKSAQIARLPVIKMPPRQAYLTAFARLVWATYPASSQWGVCERAARETMAGSPDTWERIITAKTQKPDAYLVDSVKRAAYLRGVKIPAELMVAL
jgi:hypothetical protein